ncbi:MAG: ribonuclease P protein component [Ardenticatenaceae bacterium]
MQRKYRLRANADFQRVRRTGQSVANRWFVLVWAPNELDHCRFGFAVGKKLGGAVERNKIKRRLRTMLRLHLQADQLRSGMDVVIIARHAARDADYHTLNRALNKLLGRARLWQK